MIKFCCIIFLLVLIGCQERLASYSKKRNVIESYEKLNDSTLLISGISTDPQFGYIAEKPIMVGLVNVHQGADNVEKYLNALTGPNGEPVRFSRLKPCCPFKTKNFTFTMALIMTEYDGKHGLLEKYKVEYGDKSVVLLFNLYDETKKLLAPAGFSFKAH